jgi:hypothetical protein
MSNKTPQSNTPVIAKGDEAVMVNINLADAKVAIQVIDRLFSMGGVRGDESLPIAIVRAKFIDIIKNQGDKNGS